VRVNEEEDYRSSHLPKQNIKSLWRKSRTNSHNSTVNKCLNGAVLRDVLNVDTRRDLDNVVAKISCGNLVMSEHYQSAQAK